MILYSAPGVPLSALNGVTDKFAIEDGFVVPARQFFDYLGDDCESDEAVSGVFGAGSLWVSYFGPFKSETVH